MERLGMIGLGQMGGAMVPTLLRAGFSVWAYDLRPERVAAAVKAGARGAQHVAELVAAVEVVMTSLPSSAVFVQVAETELLPLMRSGQVLIDLGTTVAGETRRLAKAFAERGVALLDVPVSGGPHGSATGTLHMFCRGRSGDL
ncbi:MAG: hypothetical protein KatS3mg115_1160 [Candidatus Poribacteria bacterium]|nr:MAG: hypothetical protein KatS3mg115_1160 [Candidatus Poribacteria bacterium]